MSKQNAPSAFSVWLRVWQSKSKKSVAGLARWHKKAVYGVKACGYECGGRAQKQKTQNKTLNKERKNANLKFKINTKF